MDMLECKQKMKCDFYGCKNLAKYSFKTSKLLFSGGMHFCEQCLNSLYSELGKIMIPKSIEAPFKKLKKK